MMEKVPVITAWLPTTAANTAITNTGHLTCSRERERERGEECQDVTESSYDKNYRDEQEYRTACLSKTGTAGNVRLWYTHWTL